jgi:hypothetical protein
MQKMCTLITSKGTDIDENIANQNHATRTRTPKPGYLNLSTVSIIHVVEGGSGNLLSAKTAQDLALIQLVNKVTELETPPKPEVSKPEVSKPEVSKPDTQPILPGNTENTDK